MWASGSVPYPRLVVPSIYLLRDKHVMKRTRTLVAVLALGVTLLIAPGAAAEDWPQWRGPNRDGVVSGSGVPSVWPSGLTQQWSVEVGSGYATPLLVGDRLYLFTRQGDDEVMLAMNPASGDILWRSAYAAPFEMNPATAPHGPGPKSTPAYADGRLFTLGMSGMVTAFDATSGEQIWQTESPPVEPLYHTAMSPIVDGDIVIFHVGGHDDGALTAFDVASGEVRWRWPGDGPAYGSPVVTELEGVRQVVAYTQDHYVGVDVETGELLWRRPFSTEYQTTSQTPVIFEGLIVQAGRGNGITAFRVVREGEAWTTDDEWHTDEASMHMTNGVVLDGVLFGLSHLNSGQYFGVDLRSGEVVWKGNPRQAENAAILRAGDSILSLQDDAQLLILERTSSGFDVVTQYEVADSATWTQPTLAGNRLFVRDVSSLTLWTLD